MLAIEQIQRKERSVKRDETDTERNAQGLLRPVVCINVTDENMKTILFALVMLTGLAAIVSRAIGSAIACETHWGQLSTNDQNTAIGSSRRRRTAGHDLLSSPRAEPPAPGRRAWSHEWPHT